MWRKVLPLLAALAWTGVIFFASSRPRPPGPIDRIDFWGSDKLGHMGEYAIWGFLAYWAASSLRGRPFSMMPVLLLGVLVGAMDETLQAFVTPRDPSPFDLLADTGGVALGAWVSLASRRRIMAP